MFVLYNQHSYLFSNYSTSQIDFVEPLWLCPMYFFHRWVFIYLLFFIFFRERKSPLDFEFALMSKLPINLPKMIIGGGGVWGSIYIDIYDVWRWTNSKCRKRPKWAMNHMNSILFQCMYTCELASLYIFKFWPIIAGIFDYIINHNIFIVQNVLE